jgi:hypothetical protein
MWFPFLQGGLTNGSGQLVLGEIAMKPNMVFAKSALSQLKAAYNLFAKVTDNTKTRDILVSFPPVIQSHIHIHVEKH